jgi:pimeloyl-ACP methyl ester carboxylesterase
MKLFFRQTGETGPAMIILHGVFGSADNWLTVGKVLGERFRVFLLDQRNHGRSPRSDAFGYVEMAADVMEFITDQGLENPVIIGHSMGGKTAMQFAMSYPDAWSKLVVVDIAPRFYPIHHARILAGLNALDLGKLTSRQAAELHLRDYEDHEGTRQFLLKNLYRNPDTNRFDWRLNLPVITRDIHLVGSELTNPRVTTKPVLFLRGEESSYVLPEDEADVRRIFPNAQIETIAGAGHWVHAEQPEAFVGAVMKFVNHA